MKDIILYYMKVILSSKQLPTTILHGIYEAVLETKQVISCVPIHMIRQMPDFDKDEYNVIT